MKLSLVLVGILSVVPLWAHPHEWVDWGVGLVLDEKKPVKVSALQLEMTWDEWFSALLLTDFPGIAQGTLSAADLKQLDTVYGLASNQRSVSLIVSVNGTRVAAKPVVQPPRTNGKTVTVVYNLPLGLVVSKLSELRVSVYDPTYYTDMGIRAKAGAFFKGVKNPAAYDNSFSYEQDFDHPYFGGTVFPEVVVFALRP